MDVTLLPMVIDFNVVHDENAYSPMDVTELGIEYVVELFPTGYWINSVFALLYNTRPPKFA